MILKQSNKPCKQEKDTEPKLPDVMVESCIQSGLDTDGRRGTITSEFNLPIFSGECRMGWFVLKCCFLPVYPKRYTL